MSPRGTKQAATLHRVPNDRVSPDDVKARIIEAQARARADTRTDAQRWLGDPSPDRSALAQRQTVAPSRSAAAPRFANWSMGRTSRIR
jgi:hypothetical protein